MANKTVTIVISPFAQALANGLMDLQSFSMVMSTFKQTYKRYWDIEERVVGDISYKVVRKEGVSPIYATRYINGVPQYAREDLDKVLQGPRLGYLFINLHKDALNFLQKSFGFPTQQYFIQRYGVCLLPDRTGKPKVMFVDYKWYKRSALYKIIYTANKQGVQNIYIPWDEQQTFETAEAYTKSITSFEKSIRVSFWFANRPVYDVFDIIRAAPVMLIKKTSVISLIRNANECRLVDKIQEKIGYNKNGKPVYRDIIGNDGRHVQQWQLELFYHNNPEGVLMVNKPNTDNEWVELYPEDKEYKCPQGEFINYLVDYPELADDAQITDLYLEYKEHLWEIGIYTREALEELIWQRSHEWFALLERVDKL